ncbi:DUF2812 domain-containing protein [Metaclostridioides mangenotii]|uniref:DUF2812 domain-containing protein n=1 Tax=Metaclostridioides mangenotii TaxID=1540 RepID=UPI0028E5BC49|nr:DUF2812 domain-containing protein [Clostridioides mangenotii]
MKKFKCFFNIDKEEKWLNEMAKSGYLFTGKKIAYYFEKSEPSNTNIKIDCRTFKKRGDFESYCTMFEDFGWKFISGGKYSNIQYFKKIDGDIDDDIFSDTTSKSLRYKRLSEFWGLLAICYSPLFASLVLTGALDSSIFTNPKSLYLTPGLWERVGDEFWSAFWFETPWAIMRGVFDLFYPVAIIFFLVLHIKAKREYKKTSDR